MTEEITTDVNGCARCHGEGHKNLTFQPFTHPIETGDEIIATHWTPCPTTGEPILLMTFVEDED